MALRALLAASDCESIPKPQNVGAFGEVVLKWFCQIQGHGISLSAHPFGKPPGVS